MNVDTVKTWLDEHPNQVPGRTVTVSAEKDLYDSAQSSGAEFRATLREYGITVIPAREATMSDRTEDPRLTTIADICETITRDRLNDDVAFGVAYTIGYLGEAGAAAETDHECRVHYEPDDRGAPSVSDAPDGWTAHDWHADATGDSGTSHVLVGPRYVIACEWCRCVFIAATKAQALDRFRDHEREMTRTGGQQ